MIVPTVEVVIATRNDNKKRLGHTIKSILNSDYENYTITIINDSILPLKIDWIQNHKLIKIIDNRANVGLTQSLINAIGESKAKYIARIDDGDEMYPTRISQQVNYLLNHQNCVLVGCITEIFIKKKTKQKVYNSKYLDFKSIQNHIKHSNPFVHGSILFCLETYNKVGGYDSSVRVAQDINLYLKMIKCGELGILNETLHMHTFNMESSITFKKNKLSVFSAMKSRAKLLTGVEKLNKFYIYGLLRDIALLIIPSKILNFLRMKRLELRIPNAN